MSMPLSSTSTQWHWSAWWKAFNDGVLIGRVVNTSAKSDVVDAEGNIDLGKMEAVAFDPINNTYRVIGDVVGHAWKSGDIYK